jgi:hypothetical protein
VSGCLVEEGQEPVFGEMARSMGDLQRLGAMRDAVKIIEKVWQHRSQVDSESWDIAMCLRSLGCRVLLV